jgi:c-di-GMP-related signal transduction protein
MTLSLPAPLLGFRVLAQTGGTPNALLLETGPGPADSLLALVASDDFAELKAQETCLFRPDIDPALAAALLAAGWQPLPEGALRRVDDKLDKDALPLGVLYVDGNWCMAPPARAQGAQAASRALALQLVQLVAADAHTHEIEALLRRDAALSYHLLRLVNSLGIGAGRKVNSFSQAILILGRQQLRRWLNLMLFAARQGDIRSPMLLSRVSVRARQLELLAKSRGMDKNLQEQAFMTGMFSLLGVLFGMPLAEVLAPLPISEAVRAALTGYEGELGAMHRLVETAEAGDIGAVALQLSELQVGADDYNAACVGAVAWMLGAVRESQAKP